MKFELPKSPASTLDEECDNADDSDNDVEFVGVFANKQATSEQANLNNYASNQQTFGHANSNGNCNITSNVGQMPLLLATPPQSPHEKQDTSLPSLDMPILNALMSNNNLAGYPPTGYVMHIPCFLCKQPFNDILSLRDHLARHATQINKTAGGPPPPPPPIPVNSNHPDPLPALAAVSRLEFANMPRIINGNTRFPGIIAPVPFIPQFPTNMPTAINMNTTYSAPAPVPATLPAPAPASKHKYICKLCGKVLRSEVCLDIHERMHKITPEQRKKWNTRAFKCNLCRKSYRLEYNLVKHMHVRHKPLATAPAAPISQPELPSQPTPPSSGDGQIIKKPCKKAVWSTKLMNAVAAANYSPASESASKYKSPVEEVNPQSMPKQKYALRSPFCNPNLWVDYDNHVP
ncbi:hypothetical protein ACLKA6_002377 [Drosophila palustris]